MHIHVRIHRWVLWWFIVGVVLGAVALVNILDRDLSRAQESVILMIGALNWLAGGIICYGYGAIRIEQPNERSGTTDSAPGARGRLQTEWHAASDFVLPGNRKSFLPPKY
jgi:hypothetical protein